jgi:hypothetical protein
MRMKPQVWLQAARLTLKVKQRLLTVAQRSRLMLPLRGLWTKPPKFSKQLAVMSLVAAASWPWSFR